MPATQTKSPNPHAAIKVELLASNDRTLEGLPGVQFATCNSFDQSFPSVLIWRTDDGELTWDAKLDRRTIITPTYSPWIEFSLDGRILHKPGWIAFRDVCLIMVKFLSVRPLAQLAIQRMHEQKRDEQVD